MTIHQDGWHIQRLLIFVLLIINLISLNEGISNEQFTAIMRYSSKSDPATEYKQCVFIQPGNYQIPMDFNSSNLVPVWNVPQSVACNQVAYPSSITNKQAMFLSNDCFNEQLQHLLFDPTISPAFVLWSNKKKESFPNEFTNKAPFVFLHSSSLDTMIRVLGNETFFPPSVTSVSSSSWQMTIYHPYNQSKYSSGDRSPFILLVLLAFCSVVVGSILGGFFDRDRGFSFPTEEPEKAKSWQVLLSALVFVAILATFLCLLYFFFDIMMWPFFILLLIMFAVSFADVTSWILIRSCRISNYKFELPRSVCGFTKINKLKLVLLIPGTVLVIVFFVYRHQNFSFILLDLLGFCACAGLIRTARFPNLRLITYLLVFLFFYDIFMVFITPQFMRSPSSNGNLSNDSISRHRRSVDVDPSDNGQYDPFSPNTPEARARRSVMEAVAIGGKEQLPLLFKIPSFMKNHWNEDTTLCLTPTTIYSYLGFGDVILPGMLIRFAFSFDFFRKHRIPFYFINVLVGYLLGFVATAIALAYMRTGQPALLYLVPGTLIPTILLALIRGELKLLWNNPFPIDTTTNIVEENDITDLDAIVTIVDETDRKS